jgi:hypothetical protein
MLRSSKSLMVQTTALVGDKHARFVAEPWAILENTLTPLTDEKAAISAVAPQAPRR